MYLRLYEYPEAKSKRFRVVGINGSRPVGGERAEPTEHDKRSAQNLARARRTIRDIGFKQIPPNSVLLVDEVGMIWDNRQFKNFKPEVRDWFKLQRHYRVKVYLL